MFITFLCCFIYFKDIIEYLDFIDCDSKCDGIFRVQNKYMNGRS